VLDAARAQQPEKIETGVGPQARVDAGPCGAENAAAKAKRPVTLTDSQLDMVTAGATATNQTAFLLANSTATLNRLLTISNFTVSFLSGSFNPFAVTP
jgi:hypothetical protein